MGVQYHPETELESHYGEMRMGRCFNMVVYVKLNRNEQLVQPLSRRTLKLHMLFNSLPPACMYVCDRAGLSTKRQRCGL